MSCKMPYTRKVRIRLCFLWLALAAMLVFMVIIGEMGLRDSRVVTGLAYSCGNMLYWCGLIFIIFRIAANKKLLKDRLRLKEKQLQERDERNQYLHRMSGGWVMDAMLALCYIAAVAASCWSNETFYTALGLLICASLLKAGAYLACSRGWSIG